MTAAGAIGHASRQAPNRWTRLASVARERASEQSDKALAASNAEATRAHLQQGAYLVKLADVYEGRARGGATAA